MVAANPDRDECVMSIGRYTAGSGSPLFLGGAGPWVGLVLHRQSLGIMTIAFDPTDRGFIEETFTTLGSVVESTGA
jgi:hypothetical protein